MNRSLLLLTVATVACVSSPDPSRLAGELMAADRQFAADVAERGLEAWVEAFGVEGVQLPASSAPARGVDQIRSLMAPAFADPSFRLEWEPREARASAAGDLGWTWGDYRSVTTAGDGVEQAHRGKYLTVWRRDEKGRWRVEADLGNVAPGDGGE